MSPLEQPATQIGMTMSSRLLRAIVRRALREQALVALCVTAGLLSHGGQPARAQTAPSDDTTYDVVIYGGTSAGIAAAVQVRRMGGSVVVIEPSRRIGGLTTGGLGQTDIGNKAAIGGVAREFYQRVRKYYSDPAHWKWQQPDEYTSGGQSRTRNDEDTMWTFEPSAALSIMQDWVDEHDIPVVYEERLDRTPLKDRSLKVRGVTLVDGRIAAITCESGRTYRGRVFIDATYEGDLLAGAGVAYTVGRESNSTYDETLNGVQTRRAIHHQFVAGVDPYVEPGNPASGLLPGIDPAGPGEEGQGDRRVQAYCFRMCLTDHPENRIPFAKPADYDPLRYELLLRNFEAGAKVIPWANSPMPNRKTDTNNNRGFSTDFIGQNYDYPEASYSERERIRQRHRLYQQGLMWTLAYHPRVPEAIRKEVSRWGTSKDEFEREDGWQQQIYVREARRMIGDYVMTQHNCQGRTTAERPVGLAAYTMDSHHVQRYVDAEGQARNEGDVQVGGFSPYPIDYGSLVPRQAECENLLVPVCLSASHMAFGSIRMEPVFMVLGQSAATAGMLAIQSQTSVQQVDYAALRSKLEQDQQVLIWTGPKRTAPTGLLVKNLPGIVLDDEAAQREGFDSVSSSIGPFVELGYRHDSDTGKGLQKLTWRVRIPQAARLEVRLAWTAHSNRATNVPVTIHHKGGPTVVRVNQRIRPNRGAFGIIGTFDFDAGETTIEISNQGTDGYVLADAIQMLPPPKRPLEPISAQLEPDRTVTYKRVGDRELTLHLFLPEGHQPSDRRPMFLTIHGGGWTGRTPRYFYPFADEFRKRGMVAASLEYRLMSRKLGTTVFDCVRDGRSAVRYLRQHAAELGIDPQRIVVSGGSAGGHVAVGTALFEDVNEPGEDTSVSSMPDLLVLYYPVIDTSSEGYGQQKIGERWRELSPVHNVRGGLPPTLLLHGTGDTVTPFAGAREFDAAMRRAGNECKLIAFPDGPHGYLIFDLGLFDESMQQTADFLEAHGMLQSQLDK